MSTRVPRAAEPHHDRGRVAGLDLLAVLLAVLLDDLVHVRLIGAVGATLKPAARHRWPLPARAPAQSLAGTPSRRSIVRGAGPDCAGRLQDVGDLATDELVPLQQRVPQCLDQVPVRVEQRVRAHLLLLEQVLDPAAAVRVAEHPADQVGVDQRRRSGPRRTRSGVSVMPDRADHLGRDVGGVQEVAARTGRHVAEEQLLGHLTAHRDLDQRQHLVAGAGEHVLAVTVREQTEGLAGA